MCFYVQKGKTYLQFLKFLTKYQNFPTMSFPNPMFSPFVVLHVSAVPLEIRNL